MKSAKTALGKTINMAALAAKHETTRAVSNIPVNARGDIIDNRGNVKISKEEIAKEFNKDILIGVEETVSIKEDQVKSKNKQKKTVDNVELDVYTSDRENYKVFLQQLSTDDAGNYICEVTFIF